MMMNSDLVLGYDFDKWYGYGVKEPVITDISTKTNSHTLLCGSQEAERVMRKIS